jgi:outer membrane protein assembly factor BamD (BamD/ComL family)
MNYRMLNILILGAGISGCIFAQNAPSAAPSPQAVCAAGETQKSEADELYAQACAERRKGNPRAAIALAARAVALHYQDREWQPRTELLCAELYAELGQTNAAAVTARQIQNLYAGTDAAKQADALLSKIEGGAGGMSE